MQLVVDANILFAALIKDSATLELLLNPFDTFFAPEFILEEFYEHKKEILEKTKRSEAEFESIFRDLSELISIIPKEDYADMLEMAGWLAPDPDDVPYLALALKLDVPIWSNDKKLKEQDRIRIYSTKDLLG
ncbi:MAG: PIN domain-containing protein [Candidatus Micrarchaeota archaeon]